MQFWLPPGTENPGLFASILSTASFAIRSLLPKIKLDASTHLPPVGVNPWLKINAILVK